MEFKVGASLWANSQESQMQVKAADIQADFRKKLELPTEPGAGMRQQDPELKEEASSYGKSLQHGRNEPDELYEWGLGAGLHLSFTADYVGFARSQSNEMPSVIEKVLPAGSGRAHFFEASSDMNVTTELAAKYATVPELRDSEAALKESDIDGADSHLQRFFAQRWPQSSFSILTRKEGLEVVIRDYYLSDVELRDLAKDIQELMRLPNETVEQIWINGRTVWQRPRSV